MVEYKVKYIVVNTFKNNDSPDIKKLINQKLANVINYKLKSA